MEYSFVVPVYNEAESVADLHKELAEVGRSLKGKFEIIFINDGSSDATQEVLERLSPVTVIQLRRNFGQTAALDAGIKAAWGKYIITLDGDGQNDPHSVPQMLEKLKETGADVVCGWRAKRKDTLWKKTVSKVAWMLRTMIINDGIRDSGCTLRVYKQECFEDVTLRGQMHRFIPALLRWKGFVLAELPVNHRPRLKGKSKYNWHRAVTAFLDMLSLWFFHKFISRPLHLLGTVGGLFTLIGGVVLVVLAVGKLFVGWDLADKIWPLVGVFFILFGFQMFVSGLIMDLIISDSSKQLYVVKNITKN